MTKNTIDDYNVMAQEAAYRIVQALNIFKDEPINIQHQAEQIIMRRVTLMRRGDQSVLDGDSFITLIEEPEVEPVVPEEPPSP